MCKAGIYKNNLTENNVIYHNDLMDNTQNAYDDGTNTWYNSTLQEGNYWSDFDEPSEGAWDNNSNGIVDTPYTVPGSASAQDLYPLMHPYGSITNLNTSEVFLTIQDAIDDTDTLAGHTIFVKNDTYYENVVVNKSINLIGEDRNGTIIDGNRKYYSINVIVDGTIIKKFTIKNAGIGIYIKDSSGNEIYNCTCMGNALGILLEYSSNNVIKNCACDNNGFGISSYVFSNNNAIIDCTFNYNRGEYGAGIWLENSSNTIISGCECNHNIGWDEVGLGYGLFLYGFNGSVRKFGT